VAVIAALSSVVVFCAMLIFAELCCFAGVDLQFFFGKMFASH